MRESSPANGATEKVAVVRPWPMAITALAMIAGMTLFEWQSDRTLPGLTMQQSKSVTVLFSSLLATTACYFVLRRLEAARVTVQRVAAKYRALTENSLDIILILDGEGVIRYQSPSVERLLGFAGDELSGRKLSDFVHSDDVAAINDLFREVLGNPNSTREMEFRCKHRDGSWRVLEAMIKNLLGDPAIHGIVVNSRDITERTATATALRESEARKTAVFETVPDGIVTIDHQGVIQEFNHAAEQIFGYPRLQAVGQNLIDLIVPTRLREAHRQGLARYVETGQGAFLGRRLEIVGMHADRSEMPLELSLSRIPIDGLPVFTGFLRDISEQKLAESALREAKEEAERANQAKSDFLARTSHELRTPLNAVLGFGQVLEMGSLPDRERECVDQILNAGRHLLGLINEVLDISGIESGRDSLAISAVRLGDVAVAALDLVRPLAAEQGIAVEWRDAATEGDYWIYADAQRLKQVLVNLLSNAVKYNRPGGSVIFSCEPDFAERLRIIVSDTGSGIASEKLTRLFTPFERLGAEKVGTEGTGLGLALSRSLVRAMGGTIGVESIEGKGTTFWIKLPRAKQPATKAATLLVTPGVHEPFACGRTVLCIDDNPSNLQLIQQIFSQRPTIALLTATKGATGLELARYHRPDLILLDLHLPDLRGDEVMQRLRDDPSTRQLPVVIISADAAPMRIEQLKAQGARDYLTKPIDLKRLLDVLDTVLREPAKK